MDKCNSPVKKASPRVITYSVSFCDNLQVEDRDTAQLLSEGDNQEHETTDIPALLLNPQNTNEDTTDVPTPEIIGHESRYVSQSCPVEVPVTASSYKPSGGGSYGAAYSSPTDSALSDGVLSPTRRVIYCIHGHASGCCMVSEGEIIQRANSTSSKGRRESTTIIDEHCHRSRDESVDKKARRKLIIASVLCVVFMIGEVVGGYLSSSLAIATDAAHLLTDFASFMISLFSLWVASRPPTRTMSFGWYRAEVIGALTSVLMIWVVTGVLVYLAIERIINKDFEIDAVIMLITSAAGVLVNLVMGLTLHQHGHSHGGGGHGHSHGAGGHGHGSEPNGDVEGASAPNEGQKSRQNINVRAAYIHVIGDFIQSFGVFVAALVIYFKPTWSIVDPICTFLFSALVLMTTFAIIRDTILVLMEGMPKGVDFSEVINTFLKLDGVIKVHNLRIWALSLDKTALSAHLAIRPGASPQNILREASRNIHSRYNFFEMTLQIEEFDEKMEDCTQCQLPEN